MQKTITVKHKNIKREWFLIDAKDEILGRLASKIAHVLMGKHKAEYYPGMDLGDYIIIVNSEKVRLTGNKYKDKIYYRHSGYMGGLKKASFMEKMKNNKSREILYDAIKGMLPKNKLGRKMIKKLKLSEGDNHIFTAQKPKTIVL
jgi:large subunit ribosomal protein L13